MDCKRCGTPIEPGQSHEQLDAANPSTPAPIDLAEGAVVEKITELEADAGSQAQDAAESIKS